MIITTCLCVNSAVAQFVDEFDQGVTGWDYFTGDGVATMEFSAANGVATMAIDARKDPHNVWWSIIKRNVASDLDMNKLAQDDFELRVEARIRLYDAPKRVNFMINTNRTNDFHEHLREYDIAENGKWTVISFTTNNLKVQPGDDVNVQLGATDFGYQTYKVELDYYKAEVVDTRRAEADSGEPLIYHPPVAPLSEFAHQLKAGQLANINTEFPQVNFSDWDNQSAPLLSVYSSQWAVMKWDFSELKSTIAAGPSVLALTTTSFLSGGNFSALYGEELGIEFGKVRVIEILGGDATWQQNSVTYHSLTQGKPYAEVFNTQMIFDTEVVSEKGGKTFITLSRPVTQRLLDGTTKGILIRPLGAVVASFNAGQEAPVLYLNVKE
ncbi:MAG: hypothetical protein HWE26_08265 [Alteromonadaceae bacterium]|nr:hypothetical protein [Alteromonadaceae bacterium]